jgi:hypothetical protein
MACWSLAQVGRSANAQKLVARAYNAFLLAILKAWHIYPHPQVPDSRNAGKHQGKVARTLLVSYLTSAWAIMPPHDPSVIHTFLRAERETLLTGSDYNVARSLLRAMQRSDVLAKDSELVAHALDTVRLSTKAVGADDDAGLGATTMLVQSVLQARQLKHYASNSVLQQLIARMEAHHARVFPSVRSCTFCLSTCSCGVDAVALPCADDACSLEMGRFACMLPSCMGASAWLTVAHANCWLAGNRPASCRLG